MKLPKPFHRQKENYEEGVIYFYHFVDSAYYNPQNEALLNLETKRMQK